MYRYSPSKDRDATDIFRNGARNINKENEIVLIFIYAKYRSINVSNWYVDITVDRLFFLEIYLGKLWQYFAFTIIDYRLWKLRGRAFCKFVRGALSALKIRYCLTRNNTHDGSTVRSTDIDLLPPALASRVWPFCPSSRWIFRSRKSNLFRTARKVWGKSYRDNNRARLCRSLIREMDVDAHREREIKNIQIIKCLKYIKKKK